MPWGRRRGGGGGGGGGGRGGWLRLGWKFTVCLSSNAYPRTNNQFSRSGGTQVAAVTFGTDVVRNFNLGDDGIDSASDVLKKLNKIKRLTGGTASHLALKEVQNVIGPFTRKLAHKVLFFITDGKHNIGKHPRVAARKLREEPLLFEIYCIGVGKKPNKRELMSIASKPYKEHVLVVPDYKTLKNITDLIIIRGKQSEVPLKSVD